MGHFVMISHLNDNLAAHKSLCSKFFFFCTLKISLYCLLLSGVAVENPEIPMTLVCQLYGQLIFSVCDCVFLWKFSELYLFCS